MTSFFDEPEFENVNGPVDDPLEELFSGTTNAQEDEIPEYLRIKIPSKDEYMSIATIYNGREDEHIDQNETSARWLTDRNGVPYKFDTKEEARVFLALNVDRAFIRPSDRPQSIEAYSIRKE